MRRYRNLAVAMMLTAMVEGLVATPPFDLIAAVAMGVCAYGGLLAHMEV